jgi:TolB protein
VLTQWFERARFEWHPNNPAEFKVLLGRLGDEVRRNMDAVQFPGGRIVYTSGENGFGDIYTMNVDGSAQRRITTTNAIPLKRADIAVSPTGNRLVYRQGANLYIVNIDGTNQSIIASADPSLAEQPELFSPVWAPDGSYVAFVLNNDIHASKADGSALIRITQTGDVITPGCLSWARNGIITFLKGGRVTNQIWTVGSNGSNPRQVGWGLCPAMTLAGDRIAYRNGGDIEVMNADGSGVRSLTSGRFFVRPLWSPDGTRILAAESGGFNDVFVLDPQNGAARQLTDDPALDALPTWSPDGTAITFASNRSGRDGVYIMLADGSGERLLPTPLESTAPQWSN